MGLVDERGELAACRDGIPMLEVGRHTDVLTGCPKGVSIELLVRSMSPAWIALDEITGQQDVFGSLDQVLDQVSEVLVQV